MKDETEYLTPEDARQRLRLIYETADRITGASLKNSLAGPQALGGVWMQFTGSAILGAADAILGETESKHEDETARKLVAAMRRCLSAARPEVEARIETVRMNGGRHPQPWSLLAGICARAARGDLSDNSEHERLTELERRLERYLESGPGLPESWVDAWHRQAHRLDVEKAYP